MTTDDKLKLTHNIHYKCKTQHRHTHTRIYTLNDFLNASQCKSANTKHNIPRNLVRWLFGQDVLDHNIKTL